MLDKPLESALALQRAADDLESKGKDLTLSPQDRRLSLRYAPFARELSRRPEFCRKLETLSFDVYASITEINREIQAIIARYRFPNRHPYDGNDWMILLASAKMGLVGFAPRFFEHHPYIQGPSVEIQFAYTGRHSWGRPPDPRFPIVVAANVMIPDEHSTNQIVDKLVTELREPFAVFRRRLKPIIKEGTFPYFDVRLVTFEPNLSDDSESQTESQEFDQPLFNASVIAETAHLLSAGSHSKRILEEVVANLMPAIEGLVALASGQGRRPDDQDHARWWAMTVFDGMTVQEIAEKDLNYDPDAADMEEMITKALRRLGIQPKT